MGDRILQILDFFIERPPLTGVVVAGLLYLVKKKRKSNWTEEERQRTLDLYEAQRSYADKMYDPPAEAEESASRLKQRG
jgi:hypothetical protein